MQENKNYFSVCFNIMKMRYMDFDRSIESLDGFVDPTDKINIFISMETILKNLCSIRDLDEKVMNAEKLGVQLVSDMINICAHYKRFFVDNGLFTRVFLYMTDLASDSLREYEWNEDYRSYYFIKYNRNPKYDSLREELNKTTFPLLRQIIEFLPNVYFIECKNIDGSTIPYTIGTSEPGYKNFILSSDTMETQYTLIPNFVHYYMKRSSSGSSNNCTVDMYLENIFKLKGKQEFSNEYAHLFGNRSFYLLLLTSIGEKYRCIDKISELTPLKVTKYLLNGIQTNQILPTTEHIDLLVKIFPEEIREEIKRTVMEMDIIKKDQLLTEEDRFQIQKQMNDRFDHASLLRLNQGMFYTCPLMLEELTKQGHT